MFIFQPQTITCMGPPPPVQTTKETEKSFFDALDQLDLVNMHAIRHFNIGIIFSFIANPDDAYMLLSQILIGCSFYSRESCKLIG